MQQETKIRLAEKLDARTAHIGVLGLGYAGLPMAVELARVGFGIRGFDVDERKVSAINESRSSVDDVGDADVAELVASGHLTATANFDELRDVEVAVVCVPTPIDGERQPDLSYVKTAMGAIAQRLQPGALVVLQSTCPVGTTRRLITPILETYGLKVGRDCHLVFAPERIDPGNQRFTVQNTPKLVGGMTPECTELGCKLFSSFIHEVLPVSSPDVAELAKLIENTFRFINISFMNEMALLCDRLGISIWETINAAATKPFAFMPHYPGPGVGGHCIPISPFLLESSARANGVASELIEAAGRVNDTMPEFVVDKLERLLSERGRELAGSRVLVLGVAYKPDVADTRESSGIRLLEILARAGVEACYHDPMVPEIALPEGRLESATLDAKSVAAYDAVLLITPHSAVDYDALVDSGRLILDTRNCLARFQAPHVVSL